MRLNLLKPDMILWSARVMKKKTGELDIPIDYVAVAGDFDKESPAPACSSSDFKRTSPLT